MSSPAEEYKVSNSEINTFLRCRRKWRLAYIEKLKSRVVSVTGPLPLGSRVHKALELYYRDNIPLMDAHQQLVEETRLEMAMEGYDMATLDGDAELGRIMLEGYLDWVSDEGLDDDLEILGTEEILQYPMLKDQVTLMGKLDLRVLKKTENLRLVQDFKTTQSFNQFNETGHMLNQLKIYQLLDMLTGTPGQRIEGGAFRLLKKVKRTTRAIPPFYQEVVIRHNVYALRSFWVQIQGILTDMVRTRNALLAGGDPLVYAYPNATRECKWDCAFHVICPLFDDGSDVDQAIKDHYDVGNPYDYYGITPEEVST